jgi:hypothetical protein
MRWLASSEVVRVLLALALVVGVTAGLMLVTSLTLHTDVTILGEELTPAP